MQPRMQWMKQHDSPSGHPFSIQALLQIPWSLSAGLLTQEGRSSLPIGCPPAPEEEPPPPPWLDVPATPPGEPPFAVPAALLPASEPPAWLPEAPPEAPPPWIVPVDESSERLHRTRQKSTRRSPPRFNALTTPPPSFSRDLSFEESLLSGWLLAREQGSAVRSGWTAW